MCPCEVCRLVCCLADTTPSTSRSEMRCTVRFTRVPVRSASQAGPRARSYPDSAPSTQQACLYNRCGRVGSGRGGGVERVEPCSMDNIYGEPWESTRDRAWRPPGRERDEVEKRAPAAVRPARPACRCGPNDGRGVQTRGSWRGRGRLSSPRLLLLGLRWCFADSRRFSMLRGFSSISTSGAPRPSRTDPG